MDSPVRKQQKRNDYLRHKMFRKINRRKKAERKQAIEAPMKELRRRLRRYGGGKKPDDDIVYETQNIEDGTVYRVHPSTFGAKELNVTTPEVVVKTRDPRKYVPTANELNISNVTSELRRRFYDHITPAGYAYPIIRTVSAALNPGRVKTIEVNPQTRRGKTIYPGLIPALRDDLFAEYLQIPKEERHKVIINAENNAYNSGELEETSIKPTNADSDKYFKFKNLSNLERDRLVRLGNRLPVGSNRLSGALRTYLGEHTIGHGHDAKGDYVSYYDKWDLAPFTGNGKDQSFGIGTPVNVYDRIYLDDYFGMPKEYRGSTYIPELTVTANKYANGKSSGIHIKPENRGKFTALKKRTGKSASWFKAHGTPAQKKMATFALNAKKWKH